MKRVFLTIDDGPSERCGELVEFLSSKRIGAILFCRGDYLKQRPNDAVKAIAAGFIIGNHSLTHADFDSLNENEARAEITKTHEIIDGLYERTGVECSANYFRFPYGHGGATPRARESNQEILRSLGYLNPLDAKRADWLWDVDVEDWHVDEENVARKLEFARERLKTLPDGGVLDLHDQEANLRLELFQRICEAAEADGVEFYGNAALLKQAKKNKTD
ncbi:MAG: polysaccharide deacetylase family protein [Candidatus Micrarchaeota archaeon]